MPAIACKLLYQSASPHIQQLYTGFQLLHRAGLLRLGQERRTTAIHYGSDAPHLRDASHAHLDAVLHGNVRIHFDTHDAEEVPLRELEDCHVYFKRSYSPAVVSSLPPELRGKVRPLGLNYRVLPDGMDLRAVRRALSLNGWSAKTLATCKQAVDINNWFGFQPRVQLMQAPPNLRAEPNVLFLVAAYDPYDDPARSREKIEDRISINATRACCIRLLKEALGPRFTGGFSHSRFAARQYPDLAVAPGTSSQVQYFRTLQSYPICVATTGLHGSIGWKLAEYVAFSKAIVSERLLYQVPGSFAPGKNYIEFSSPEECASGAIRLVEDSELRREIMLNNAAYYRDRLRPDALVRNALQTALEQAAS
ncbi:MAG: hypothetical protein JSR66_19130 [Proteobacteria bacterium]|nr:hypothetical protein [Pseudomonadota bacterium]